MNYETEMEFNTIKAWGPCFSALDGSVTNQMCYFWVGTDCGFKLILVNHIASENIHNSVF